MNWDDLKLVLAVAREGTVAAAAKALGVAHTTVYRRLEALDAAWGTPMFDRTGGACVPTEAGRLLLALAGDVEHRLVAFERVVAGKDERLAGDVTVATMEPLAIELAGHLLALRQLHRAIRVHLHVTDAFVDLAQREADVALRATRAPDETLVGRKIADVAFAVYGTDAHAARDPADRDWVCFDPSRGDTPQGRWEAEHVPADRTVFRTSSRAVFLAAVAAGGGVGVVPCGLAAGQPGLRALSAPIGALALPLWLVAHADLARTPRVAVVTAFLADALAHSRPRLEGIGVGPSPDRE